MLAMAHPASRLHNPSFLADLQEDGKPVISPRRFAALLNIELQQLAELAHVHRNTVSQRPESAQLQEYLRAAVRVLTAAIEVSEEDVSKTIYWFRNQPIQPLDYKTPELLVSEGKAEQVLHYLQMLDASPIG
jgi:hypothetical protein